ncbi:MAG: hypothetical protein F6K24_35920 [Okeania sp. SIO2D1]|nr:hypothetical protein [Okeania sp. SIO2D1]
MSGSIIPVFSNALGAVGWRSVAEVDHLGVSANTGVEYAVVRIVQTAAKFLERVAVNWEKLVIIGDAVN